MTTRSNRMHWLIVLIVLFTSPSAALAEAPDARWEPVAGVGLGPMRDLAWVDERRAWLATGDGSLLHTEDGGRSWHNLPWPDGGEEAGQIIELALRARPDGSVFGWALATGGHVLHTPDGQLWERQHQFERGVGGGPLTVLDEQHVWIGGPGSLERSRDGGETWERFITVDDREINLRQVNAWGFAWRNHHLHFRNQDHGTAISSTRDGWAIRTTDDGGETWATEREIEVLEDRRELIVLESPEAQKVYSMNVLLYVHGELPLQRGVARVLARRATWSHMTDPQDWHGRIMHHGEWRFWIVSDEFIASRQPLMGEATSIRTNLFVSEGEGESWRRLVRGENLRESPWQLRFGDSQLTAAASPGPGALVAVGTRGRVSRTGDGGQNWHHTFLPTTADLQAVDFVDEHGWIGAGPSAHDPTGTEQEPMPGAVWHTTDAGQSWQRLALVENAIDAPHSYDEGVDDLVFANEREGWAVTRGLLSPEALQSGAGPRSYGRILHTTDGGRSWEVVYKGGFLNSIALHDGVAVAVGASRVLRSENGVEWTQAEGPGARVPGLPGDTGNRSVALQRVDFIDRDRLVAFGQARVLLTSEDRGRSWRLVESITREDPLPEMAHFVSPQVGWTALWDGIAHLSLRVTTNGGRTWSDEPIAWPGDGRQHYNRWIEIVSTDANEVWAVTRNIVLRKLSR